MKKIQINESLSRLSKKQFEDWFKSRKELEKEDMEAHYKALHPTKEVKK